MQIKVHADNTITTDKDARPFGKIVQDSYQMASGQRGSTMVQVYKTGAEIKMDAPLYVPAIAGSVSDWKINPEFEAELAAKLAT